MNAPARIQSDSTLDVSHEGYRFPAGWEGCQIVAHFDHRWAEVMNGNDPYSVHSAPVARLMHLTVTDSHGNSLWVSADEAERQGVPVTTIEDDQTERMG